LQKPAAPDSRFPGQEAANEKAATASRELLQNALAAFVQAEQQDLKPFIDRVLGIIELDDVQLMAVAFERLRADYPQFLEQISATQKIIEGTEAAALLNGMAEGAVDRSAKTS
jgi:hypothetical protein